MQMDEMTQQNAALVEQATAASQSMADQARQLTNMMDRYQTGESQAQFSSRPTEHAAPVRTERRGPNRPFAVKSKPAAKPAASNSASAGAPPAPQRKLAAANSGDSEWSEF